MTNIKAILKSLFYRLGYYTGYQFLLLDKIKQKEHVTVLSLHRISPQSNPFWQPLTPKIFSELVHFLKKHFTILTLKELETVHAKKPKLVLSFDDGYYDFIDYAMPILKKHNLCVNQNIIPSQVLGEKPLWNIALYDFLNAAPLSLIKELHFPGFDAKQHINRKFDKTAFAITLSRFLKQLPHNKRDLLLQPIEERLFSKLVSWPTTRMIRLNEIHHLREHEIGAHSYSHNSMENESMDYFIDDFSKCRNFFQTYQLGAMDIYAFPNGSYRREQITYLKQNGIQHILLVGDCFATNLSPYHRFNIGAFTYYEAIFQAIGIKEKKIYAGHTN